MIEGSLVENDIHLIREKILAKKEKGFIFVGPTKMENIDYFYGTEGVLLILNY